MAKRKLKLNIAQIGTKAIGLGAGAVAAKAADSLPFVSTQAAPIRALAKVALGVALPMFVKNDMVGAAGDGMIAVGIADLAKEYIPGISGIGETFYAQIKGSDVDPVAIKGSLG